MTELRGCFSSVYCCLRRSSLMASRSTLLARIEAISELSSSMSTRARELSRSSSVMLAEEAFGRAKPTVRFRFCVDSSKALVRSLFPSGVAARDYSKPCSEVSAAEKGATWGDSGKFELLTNML